MWQRSIPEDYLEGSDEQEGRVGAGSRWSKGPEQMELGRVRSFMNQVVEFLGFMVEPQKTLNPPDGMHRSPLRQHSGRNQVTLALGRLGDAAFSGGSPE